MELFWIAVLLVIFVLYWNRDGCKLTQDLSKFGKWAVITGATDGIGKSFAFELARKGFNVALISRNIDKLNNVARQIEKECSVATKTVQADFTSADSEMYSRIGGDLKNLDIGVLVNNVGTAVGHPEYFHELEKHHSHLYVDIVNCNIVSTVQMTRLVLPGMVERRRGLIVNVASGLAKFPSPLHALYGSSKSFVTAFSKALDIEYKEMGIHVHALTTGLVVTKLSGATETSFLVPDADTYARSALKQVENHQICDGYIGHQIVSTVGTLMLFIFPGFMNTHILKQFKKARIEQSKTCQNCYSL